MLGLAVLLIVMAYAALMIWAVAFGRRRGRRDGGSRRMAAAYAGLGFLVVYLPVFWNHIPVLLAHRSMCVKDAGFKSDVTPQQWIAQNKEAIGKLTKESVLQQELASRRVDAADGYQREVYFGGLLAAEWRGTVHRVLNVDIHKDERRIVDVGSGQTLATFVDYSSSGHPDNIRGWIFPDSCQQADSGALRAKYFEYVNFAHVLGKNTK